MHFLRRHHGAVLSWITIAAALAAIPTAQCFAQYRVFAWENFESGTLSDSLKMVFKANASNTQVYDYNSPDAPPGILGGIAAVECGRYGLRFNATPDQRQIGVVNNLTLDRRGLGDKGRALYQADFYLTDEGTEGENLAVLAVLKPPPGESLSSAMWRNYRVGILNGNKIYFSYADGTKKKGSPVIYTHETLSGLSRPGWHRLQLIFEGQDKIICAVDGKATGFSPIIEPSLDQLHAGLMVTVPPEQSRTYYADNLSIQWTPEDLPLPDSPWVNPTPTDVVSFQPPVSGPGQVSPAQPATSPGGYINWFISPEQAWAQAKVTGKPLLLMFYAPKARTYQRLEQILQSDPTAKRNISGFIPLRLDVNQLKGGQLAGQYSVFRVPTFIVFGLDSKEKARVTFDRSSTWPEISAQLERGYMAAKQQK